MLEKLKGYYWEAIVFSVFLIITILLTYPLVFRLKTYVYGYPWPGDPFGTIWHFWWIKYAFTHHISPYLCPLLAAPFGANLSIQYNFLNYIVLALSFLFNEVVIYNLLVLASFPLSAFTMYLLVHYLTKNRIASVLAGLIFTFSPYHTVRAQAHLTLAHIEWMPLYVLSLLMLDKNRNWKNAVFCGLSFALVVINDLYYGFFMLIFTGIFFLYKGLYWLISTRRIEINFKRVACYPIAAVLAGLLIVIFNLNLFSPASASRAQERVHRITELIFYSARPWDYLLPAITNPIFGGFTKPFIDAHIHGSNTGEQTLYLGYIPLLLALIGVIHIWIKRKTEEVDKQKKLAVGFLSFGAIAAMICSAPPYVTIAGLTIYFPSYFLYKLIPMFRVYSRFGIVVMMCVGALAGVGADYLLRQQKSRKVKALLVSVIVVILGLEFAFIPQLTPLSSPAPVYKWLAKQKGDFIMAEYPLVMSENVVVYDYMFNQRYHGKRLVNGASPYTTAEEWRILLSDISDPNVPTLLSYLKVKYVVVHPDKYGPGKKEAAKVPEAGLRLVKSFNTSKVYEVTAKPAELIAVPQKNFDRLEKWEDEDWRWLFNDGELLVINSSSSQRRASLRFRAKSFIKPRRLQVKINGRVAGSPKITSGDAEVYEIRDILIKPGKNKITLHASPDAQLIDSVYQNLDTRKVSIAFDWMKLEPAE